MDKLLGPFFSEHFTSDMMGFGHAFPVAQSHDSRAKLAALEKADETSGHAKGTAGPEKVKLISTFMLELCESFFCY